MTNDNVASPAPLVSTEWVSEHLEAEGVRLVEVDVDFRTYTSGHLPNAVGWDWKRHLSHPVVRDILDGQAMARLCSAAGIEPDTTVVVYGDSANWFATWAFWLLVLHGHADVRLMDGGRDKWVAEDRQLTMDAPIIRKTRYPVPAKRNSSIRVLLNEVQTIVQEGGADLIDVRSEAEFTGQVLAPPGLGETCQRGGHLPGAINVPWSQLCRSDGRFKPVEEIRSLMESHGVRGECPIVVYCRIGERSSHTWFALQYLLGFDDVRNYDGSWTEWGNLIGAPVER